MIDNFVAHVTVITVTYGKRWHLLRQVLTSAFNQGVKHAVIVDNASQDAILLNATTEFGDKVHVVTMSDNTGSAKGYAAGMLTALDCSSAEFFWLLDDDNCPLPHALERLLDAYKLLGRNDTNVLLSLRKDRTEYLRAALTGTSLIYRRNAFQGFHLCDIPARFLKKIRQSDPSESRLGGFMGRLVPISYAPYGGLFLHRNWIAKVGVPDERFYLYGDDHEYTYRILGHGGEIFLCTDSEIEDIEISWNLQLNIVPAFFSDSVDSLKLVYSLRNRVYFEKKSLTDNTLIYLVNIFAYLLYLVIKSIFLKVPISFIKNRLLLVCCAIKAGLSGKLGKLEAGSFT